MTKEKAKRAAARKALEWVEDGMRIGLGSGSTSHFFIKDLIERCQKGLKIEAIASSKESEQLARKGGIPILEMKKVDSLDLCIDGADEVDGQKRLIKGAGGALVREKIVASMSKKMVVIVDDSKISKTFEKALLPIEVIPFCPQAVEKHLQVLGLSGTFRKTETESYYVTDNQNWIIDLTLPSPLDSPENLHEKLLKIPGVVDTGFFFQLAQDVVIGYEDGKTKVM